MDQRLFVIACLLSSSVVLVQCQRKPVQNCTDVPPQCRPDIQTYLTDYGYLDPDMNCDKFEADLRAALFAFQGLILGFKGVNVTGECDDATVLAMKSPRCGCEDMPNKDKIMMPRNLLGPQEYRTGNTMWRKRALTWRVTQYPTRYPNTQLSHADINDAFKRALQIWADVADISFSQTSSSDTSADINISFEIRRHTGVEPFFDFDGKGGVLAHAFFPESGLVHFDDDEKYVLGSNDGTELYIVAAHEFGHTLGISHSNINSALMAPYYRYSEKLELDADDIAAVRSIYGPKKGGPRPTQPPTTMAPRPTTVPKPTYCSMKVDSVLKIDRTTYVFTRERVGRSSKRTFVYTVTSRGLEPEKKTQISTLFQRGRRSTYRGRAHPYRVDAAVYMPAQRQVFLFSGTRVYRYTKGSSKFELDPNYPRWMNVREFPERPRAAIAMPYGRVPYYYMLIFGSTMVWNWDMKTQEVGAWAYPITSFGRNMPLRMDGAYAQDSRTIVFIQGDKAIDFDVPYRRVMGEESKKSLASTVFKGRCM